jgi:hypothetical protein
MTRNKIIELALLGVVAAGGGLGCVGNAAQVGEEQSAVTGGTRVRNGQFDGTVQIGVGCSGTKIGARRFLTAAHCLDDKRLAPLDLVRVTSDVDGLSGIGTIYTLTVVATRVHPSWELAPVVLDDRNQRSRDLQRVYDVALLDVQELTPDIPTVVVSTDYFGDRSPDFFLVGFGCDNVTKSDGGKKQYAVFDMPDLDFWWDTSAEPADEKRGIFRHNILGWTNDEDDGCPGDSGGSYLMFRNSRWELLGVMSSTGDSGSISPFIFGARTSNIGRWLANPGKNDFRDGSIGYLMNGKSGKCADLLRGNLDNEAAVAQYWCEGDHGPTQRIRLVDVDDGWLQLRDEGSGKCFSGRTPGFGDKVAQFDCNSTDSLQRWRFESRGSGVFQVRNQGKNQCLGVDRASVDDEAKLGIFGCAGSGPADDQSWVFTR